MHIVKASFFKRHCFPYLCHTHPSAFSILIVGLDPEPALGPGHEPDADPRSCPPVWIGRWFSSSKNPLRRSAAWRLYVTYLTIDFLRERMGKQLHLNLFVHGRGHHEAGWRHPGASRQALTDIDYLVALARRAEAGCFDSVFLADALALGDGAQHIATGGLEPITALAALSQATSHIGLIGTASTTYTEPFNLARQFSSLDHISRGRVGWNIVTSWVGGAGPNFGYDVQIEHAERYARAHEFSKWSLHYGTVGRTPRSSTMSPPADILILNAFVRLRIGANSIGLPGR
jgi:hypothetical protein